ncbi:SH3 domain-containing protein [Candidatus Oscillochloris fontis]|uniref:SH3 domain-containing protein n=1 Tax=Candidatus Oscillochloris fontis TaxID=2496868 RepID=UPI00101E12B6|nr:SH3 domain-containing protein [Candidatus Oscillochloris fontis]
MMHRGAVLRALLFFLAGLVLAGCGNFVSALPAQPSPFPTLARLPSVTPVTPRPTRPPTPSPSATPTATPVPPQAEATINANLRSGPSTNTSVVAVVRKGTRVSLLEREDDWYRIRTPDATEGWMASTVLKIDPDLIDQVPLAP